MFGDIWDSFKWDCAVPKTQKRGLRERRQNGWYCGSLPCATSFLFPSLLPSNSLHPCVNLGWVLFLILLQLHCCFFSVKKFLVFFFYVGALGLILLLSSFFLVLINWIVCFFGKDISGFFCVRLIKNRFCCCKEISGFSGFFFVVDRSTSSISGFFFCKELLPICCLLLPFLLLSSSLSSGTKWGFQS